MLLEFIVTLILSIILIGLLFYYKKKLLTLSKESEKKIEENEQKYNSLLEIVGSIEKLTQETKQKEKELQELNESKNQIIANTDLEKNKLTELQVRNTVLEETIQKHIATVNDIRINANQEITKLKEENQERINLVQKSLKEELLLAQQKREELNAKVNSEIAEINEKLENWKQTEAAARREREERENTKQFNRLIISRPEEITQLMEVCHKLSNPIPLYKAIYDIYYKTAVSDLFLRLGIREDICGIYKITNQSNGKIYIGKSTNIKRRWTEHIKRGTGCESGSQQGQKLYKAMLEEGVWNFSFEILEETTKEKYSEREKFWIEFFDSVNYGYNMKKG